MKRGGGSLYHPKYRDAQGAVRESPTWWARYRLNGRDMRESTDTTNLEQARKFLHKRLGSVAKGETVNPKADRVTFATMADALRRDYRMNDKHLVTLEARLKHLLPAFGERRMARLLMADVERYKDERQQSGASNGSLNRELEVLARAFALGRDQGVLTVTLPVRRARLAESAPRSGFFEAEQYEAVRAALGHPQNKRGTLLPARPDLVAACDIAYTLGWRMQSEVLALAPRHVNLEAGTLMLDPGMAKNDEPRIVYLTPELTDAIRAQLDRVDALQRQLGAVVPYLFPHLRGRRRGQRILDFGKRWRTACRQAGVPGMLRHDCRRSAVRNLVAAGVPERVAMSVTGHKTRSVFDRYHIVSPKDLQEAARKLAGTLRVTLQDAGQNGASERITGHTSRRRKSLETLALVGG